MRRYGSGATLDNLHEAGSGSQSSTLAPILSAVLLDLANAARRLLGLSRILGDDIAAA